MSEAISGTDTGAADTGATPAADGADTSAAAAVTAREWMAALPEDLRSDPTLSRYETPEAQMRAHLEARKLASSRVIVPGKDADEASRNAFYSAIGRPEKADGYAFDVPDDDGARALAGKFAERAFQIGMPKDMAEEVVRFNNEQRASELQAYQEQTKAEFDAWRQDKPDAEARISQIGNMFKRHGIGETDAAEIEARLGTRKMFDLFDGLARATGEHTRQDGERGDGRAPVTSQDAETAYAKRIADPQFRADVMAGKTEAVDEYERLVQARVAASKPRK